MDPMDPRVTTSSDALAVVTAASALYGRTLWQFFRSAERHGVPARHPVLAFDLGLAPADRRRLERDFPWVRWLDAPDLPPHAAVAARTYAWKPVVIAAAAHVQPAPARLLWLDSATLLQDTLDEVDAAIREYGVYTLAGQSALQDRCEPGIWSRLRAPLEILHRPERAAGVVGFDLRQPAAAALLAEWRGCADDPTCWHPLNARHRPEQALLSLLIYRAEREGRLRVNPGEIDISCAAPVRWLTTRNKVAPAVPTAADPAVRLAYAVAKRADRAALRLRAAKQRRVDGWHRYPKEHFTVLLGRTTADLQPVPAPPDRYYADPFPAVHEGQAWLFVEEYRYAHNAGRLLALPVNPLPAGGFAFGAPRALDVPGEHLSFPFVFRHAGEWLLVPETSRQRTVDLYSCVEFPHRWRLRRRLLADVDAADSTLVHHEGRWYLFTSTRSGDSGTGRALAVFHAADLFEGEWTPHPVNAERRHAHRPHSYGRNAGPLVQLAITQNSKPKTQNLLRPIHSSERYYGERVHWLQVTTLTPERCEEAPWSGPHPLLTLATTRSLHHLAVADGFVACDTRDRISYLHTLTGRLIP